VDLGFGIRGGDPRSEIRDPRSRRMRRAMVRRFLSLPATIARLISRQNAALLDRSYACGAAAGCAPRRRSAARASAQVGHERQPRSVIEQRQERGRRHPTPLISTTSVTCVNGTDRSTSSSRVTSSRSYSFRCGNRVSHIECWHRRSRILDLGFWIGDRRFEIHDPRSEINRIRAVAIENARRPPAHHRCACFAAHTRTCRL